MPRQYVSVKFAASKRSYTYHNDRDPVAVGDRVVVSTDRGPQTVEVVELWDTTPGFATKPIVGKERQLADPAPAQQTEAPSNPFGPAKGGTNA